MKRNNAGFTLIEVLISIVILGLVVVPVCSGLLVSVRVNDRAEQVLDAKLAVSSAVEELMAEGTNGTIAADRFSNVNIETLETTDAYLKIKVTSTLVDTVTVTTYIHVAEETTAPTNAPGGDGT